MNSFADKSSNEIKMELQRMEIQHKTIKEEILKYYDELEKVEKLYEIAYRELLKRLNGK